MTDATPPARPRPSALRVPVCGERTSLPHHLVAAALAFAPAGTAEVADVQQHLRCTLQHHTTGDHYALVMDIGSTGSGAVWTNWIRGHQPSVVVVLLDCDATGPEPAYEPCCEFAGHPGAHSFDITDPLATTSRET